MTKTYTQAEFDALVRAEAEKLNAERREKAGAIIEALESELSEIRQELGAAPKAKTRQPQTS